MHRALRTLVSLALSLVVVATATRRAEAQPDAVALDQYRVTPSPRDGFTVSRPAVLGHLDYAAQLSLDYALNPLVYELDPGDADSERYSVVRHQLVGAGTFSVGFFDRLMLYAVVPVSLVMRGDAPSFEGLPVADGTRMGDPTLGGRILLVGGEDDDVFSLGTQLAVSLPLARWADGGQRYAGDETAVFVPQILAEVRAGRTRINLQVGGRFRGIAHAETLDVGQELTYAAGLAVGLTPSRRLELLAEVFGATTLGQDRTFGRANTPLEAIVGAKYHTESCVTAGAAFGTGLMRGYGSPDVRAVAMIGYAPRCNADALAPAPEPVVEPVPEPGTEPVVEAAPEPTPPPVVDTDGDGLLDDADACPNEAEDRDGIVDEDGCPEADADADTIADEGDSCPLTPGVPNPARPDCQGCPAHACVTADGTIEILDRVEFATSSDVILPQSDAILSEVARILETNTHIRRVRVEGHTDDRGNDASNLELSERRAASVARWLSEHGVAADRLESVGYGETRPLRPGRSAGARQANRRVEFHIVDPAPAGGNDQTITR